MYTFRFDTDLVVSALVSLPSSVFKTPGISKEQCFKLLTHYYSFPIRIQILFKIPINKTDVNSDIFRAIHVKAVYKRYVGFPFSSILNELLVFWCVLKHEL